MARLFTWDFCIQSRIFLGDHSGRSQQQMRENNMLATVHSSLSRDEFSAFKWCLSVALLILGMPCLILAQATSTIQGQVTDTSGGAVVGATVKATNEDTGFNKTVVSASDGFYRI